LAQFFKLNTPIRGLPLSTSTPRGGGEGVQKLADFADKQSYRSADKGGVKKSENLAAVLNGSPLIKRNVPGFSVGWRFTCKIPGPSD